ncbi:MAG TPA: ATP-binding protein [Anaerolineae bacterium]|nr:ATP-binding protein [Anaerolineae bacterium]
MRNPYISGPPIQDPDNFYGRREAIDRISAMLSGPQLQSLMLLGLRRAGKTSLLNYITHARVIGKLLTRPDDHILAYVNLEADVRTPTDFFNLLARRVLESAKQMPSLYSAILSAHSTSGYTLSLIERLLEVLNRKTTVLLDEFEVLTGSPAFSTEFFNGLRSLVARYPFAWITASYRNLYQLGCEIKVESSPFFNIFNQAIYVGAMSGEEVQELVLEPARHARRPFTDEDGVWIERLAGGLPCFVQKAAELLYTARESTPENIAAAREAAARAFTQWAAYHYQHYWKHFNEDERDALTQVAAGREANWSAYRVGHGSDALDALVGYGLLIESGQGYQVRGAALKNWIAAQVRPLRQFVTPAPGDYSPPAVNRGGSRMLEAAQVSILAKAIDFIFEQGRLILQERRERRQVQPAAPAESDAPAPADEPLLPTDLTKTEALRKPIRLATWSVREAEVKHLVSLLEIQARNYWLAKEQYARWGSALVPPVIVSNLEEAENSVSETTARLNTIINDLYVEKAEAPIKEAP